MITRFDRIHERDGRTDGRTDRRTDGRTDTAWRHRQRLCIESHSKNEQNIKQVVENKPHDKDHFV